MPGTKRVAPELPEEKTWYSGGQLASLFDLSPSMISEWAKRGCPKRMAPSGGNYPKFFLPEVLTWLEINSGAKTSTIRDELAVAQTQKIQVERDLLTGDAVRVADVYPLIHEIINVINKHLEEFVSSATTDEDTEARRLAAESTRADLSGAFQSHFDRLSTPGRKARASTTAKRGRMGRRKSENASGEPAGDEVAA